MAMHQCPVCGKWHFIPRSMEAFAYGRQLTCSPRCKARLAGQVRRQILLELQRRTGDASQENIHGG